MNFFERQNQARRKTVFLIVSFLIASVAIIVIVDFVALMFFGTSAAGGFGARLAANANVLLAATVLTALLIGGGTAFKMATLNNGGGAVARSLGATEVPAEPRNARERQLRNVVEEVAIASGMPVPEIYLLEHETAINAFAAGMNSSDAAITVTRGAMERLNRAELQGVIAHEFSHVANGDMRLNLKLMGWVFGLLLLAIAGRFMIYGALGSRKGAALAAIGLALMVTGFVGLFAGRFIKAAVSRERERLADASAVQFTRNPSGLAGALKKIGGYKTGSRLRHTDTEQVNHMLFASSLSGFLSGLFATHPPLEERIRALDASFDPDRAAAETPAGGDTPAQASGFAPRQASRTPAQLAAAAGAPDDSHLRTGEALHRSLPKALREAARDPEQAPLLIRALALNGESLVREKQRRIIREASSEEHVDRVEALAGEVQALNAGARLPLLSLIWPALKALPPEDLNALGDQVRALARADQRVTVMEYALARSLRVLAADLADGGADPGRVGAHRLRGEIIALFAIAARAGHGDPDRARRAFDAGMAHIADGAVPFEPPADWQPVLDRALDRLDRLAPPAKQRLIEGLATVCANDGVLNVDEAELLRAIGLSLHCPLPPLPLAD